MGALRRLLLIILVAAVALGSLMGTVREGSLTQILEGPELLLFVLTLIRYMILAAFLGLTLIMVYYRKLAVEALKSLILYLAHKRKREWSTSMLSVLALLTVYTLVSLLLLFQARPAPDEPTLGTITYTGTTQTTASGGTQNATGTSLSFAPYPDTVYTTAIGLLMIAAIFVAGVIIVQSLIRAREEAASLEKEGREEVVKAIRESVFELESSLSCREAIIRCYKRFCELLESRGLSMPDHQTAREFREMAARFLRLPEEPLEGLTGLFEEARYSSHEMTSQDREEALKHLRGLEHHLSVKRGD